MSQNRRSYGPRFNGGGGGGGGRARHHNPYPSFGGGGGRPTKGGAKISIANLDSEVTDGDVREIFQQVGRVASAVVNYDVNGRSRGTAEVSFSDPRIAAKAVQEYDRAEVDGRPMFLTLVGGGGARNKVLVSRMQPRFQQEDHSRGRGGQEQSGFQDLQDQPRKSRGRNLGGGGGGRGRRKNSNNRGNDGSGQRSGGQRRGGGGRGGGGRGRRNNNKNSRPQEPTKTAEQLDKELEDYHKKSGGSTTSSSSKSGGSNKPLSSFTGQPSRPGN